MSVFTGSKNPLPLNSEPGLEAVNGKTGTGQPVLPSSLGFSIQLEPGHSFPSAHMTFTSFQAVSFLLKCLMFWGPPGGRFIWIFAS